MDDLQRRFAALNRIEAPDLWPAIQRQAVTLSDERRLARVPSARPTTVNRTPAFRDRPMLVLLIAIALVAAVGVGAVSFGAVSFSSVPASVSSAAVPSAGIPTSGVPSPMPSGVTPSSVPPSAVAVAPSASPSGPGAGGCPPRHAVATTALTPIAVGDYVSKLVFSGCFMWARIAANNGGIAKVDLGTNRVVDTIVPAEIVGDSMTASDVGILADTSPSVIEPDTPIHLTRIDPVTDAATNVLDLPVNGDFVVLDGLVWNRKWRSGELWLLPLDGSKPAVKSGTISPFIGAAFGSVWTRSTDGTSVERWDAPGSAPTATVDVGDASQCLIVDSGIACVLPRQRVVLIAPDTSTVAWDVQIPQSTGDLMALAAAGGSIWVQPATSGPGRVDASELIELDAASGNVLRRVKLTVRQPLNLWAGGGSLWIAAAGQPLTRVDLPAR